MYDASKDAICFGEKIITKNIYPFTLSDVLLNTVNTNSNNGISFIDKNGNENRITYSDLLVMACEYSGGLLNSGLKRGDYLIFQINDNYQFVITFWACILSGIVPVLLNTSDNFDAMTSDNKVLLNVINIMGNAKIITNNRLKDSLSFFVSRNDIQNNPLSFEELEEKKKRVTPVTTTNDNVALILFTSGSTGMPKGVTLTHSNIVNLEKAVVQMNNFMSTDVSINWMPLEHVGGLVMFHIRDVFCGAEQVQIRKEYILANPLRWIQAISDYKATVTWAPNFAFSLVNNQLERTDAFNKWDLSKMRFVLNGGEAINAATARKFLKLLSKYRLSDDSIFPSWGMSETSSGTVYAHNFNSRDGVCFLHTYNYFEKISWSLNSENSTQFVQLGSPIPGAGIRIVDLNGKLLKENVIGHVQITGKNITPGYYNNEELNKQVFVKSNWFDTGDIGFISDGQLVLTGRLKDIIIINGINFSTSEIEYSIETLEGIVPSYTVAVSVKGPNSNTEELVVFFVSEKEIKQDILEQIKTIKEMLLHTFRLKASDVIPVNREIISKTSIGKIKRAELVKSYLEGQYKGITEHFRSEAVSIEHSYEINDSTKEIQIYLKKLTGNILGLEDIRKRDSFFERGGSSIDVIMLASEINKAYKVDVPISKIFELQTLELIADFIEQASKVEEDSIFKVELQQSYPVSSSQKRMLMLNEMEGIGCTYNNPLIVELTGELDTTLLERAFQTLIKRHDILRSTFQFVDGAYVQIINDVKPFVLERKQLQRILKSEIAEILDSFVRPFSLDQPYLIRSMLVRSQLNRYLLAIDMHHVITDGPSQTLLMNELFEIYTGEVSGNYEELSVSRQLQYKDYANWEFKNLNSIIMKRKENFWLEMHNEYTPHLELQLDYPRSLFQSFDGKVITNEISLNLVNKLQQKANSTGSTLFTLLFAAYNLLLAKYSGNEELVVGTLVNGRIKPETFKMIGLFTNTLAIKSYPRKSRKISEFITELKETLFKSWNNHDYPFDKLVDKLGYKNNATRNPIFDTMFVYQNYDNNIKIGEKSRLKLISQKNIIIGSKTDITLYGVEKEDGIELLLEYCPAIFKQSTMERFLKHFLQILTQVIDVDDTLINDLQLLDVESHKLLNCNSVQREEYPSNKTIHELFQDQVTVLPNSPAIYFRDQVFSNTELNARSHIIARELQKMGVGRCKIVAILIERSTDLLTAMLGITYSGAAFLPIDTELPEDRVKYMLQDSNAAAVVTAREMKAKFDLSNYNVLDISGIENSCDYENIINVNDGSDPIYVYYTSGSTGKPKGVVVSHQAVNNFIHGFKKAVGINQRDLILSITTISFDPVIVETFLSLVFGIPIVLTTSMEQRDVNEIAYLINSKKISVLQITPSRLELLLKNKENKKSLKNLRKLIIGGEKLTTSLYNCLTYLTDTDIYNVYGPTETTVWTTVKLLTPDSRNSISIGTPIQNMEIYILDEQLRRQPIGIPGEIYISGDGVALGYLNQPQLTDAKFVDNPYRKGNKMYASGDRGIFLENGEIVCLGRLDNQIKINGYRIELDEIKKELLQSELVDDAVPLILDQSICVYYVSRKNTYISELKQHLSSKLPAYMVPNYFVQVNSIPLTISGKTDTKKLPKPFKIRGNENFYEAPVNEVEMLLTEMWQEILGVTSIGIHDNFFELGGNSFKGTTFIYRLQEVTGKLISLSKLYKNPTIRLFSKVIDLIEQMNLQQIQPAPYRDHYPLTPQQQLIFGAASLDDSGLAYNIPVVFEVKGDLDVNRLHDVLVTVLLRHNAFRIYLDWYDEEVVQKIDDTVQFNVEIKNIMDQNIENFIRLFVKPFDLYKAPLIRVMILTNSNDNYILFDMHHIISDGVSLKLLFDEVSQLYSGKDLPTPQLQYTDYAWWINREGISQSEEQYWLNRLNQSSLKNLNLVTDFIRLGIRNFKGDSVTRNLDKRLFLDLRNHLSDNNQTLFTGLCAAFYLLLHAYSGEQDIIIGTPVSTRQNNDFSKVVGMFTNTIALRQTITPEVSMSVFLENVNLNLIQDLSHQNYPITKLLNKLGYRSSIHSAPLFNVMIVFQNFEFEGISIEGARVKYYLPDLKTTKYDLVLSILPEESGLKLSFDFSVSLWKRETILELSDNYCEALKFLINSPDLPLSEFRPKGDRWKASNEIKFFF